LLCRLARRSWEFPMETVGSAQQIPETKLGTAIYLLNFFVEPRPQGRIGMFIRPQKAGGVNPAHF